MAMNWSSHDRMRGPGQLQAWAQRYKELKGRPFCALACDEKSTPLLCIARTLQQSSKAGAPLWLSRSISWVSARALISYS